MSRRIDMSGKRFGRLTVIQRSEQNINKKTLWVCRCDCGKEISVPTANLKSGNTKSCGCLNDERQIRNIVGQRFGRITVKAYSHNKNKMAMWICLCDCGKEKIIAGKNLLSGMVQSCGCIRDEHQHHLYGTRVYRIWKGMKARCNFPSQKSYKSYGGRGIKVCEEWGKSFQKFYDWAMKNGYKDDLTIDRINNDGNYEPDNCRWLPKSENTRNQSHKGGKHAF